jgi:hypothetical protein
MKLLILTLIFSTSVFARKYKELPIEVKESLEAQIAKCFPSYKKGLYKGLQTILANTTEETNFGEEFPEIGELDVNGLFEGIFGDYKCFDMEARSYRAMQPIDGLTSEIATVSKLAGLTNAIVKNPPYRKYYENELAEEIDVEYISEYDGSYHFAFYNISRGDGCTLQAEVDKNLETYLYENCD